VRGGAPNPVQAGVRLVRNYTNSQAPICACPLTPFLGCVAAGVGDYRDALFKSELDYVILIHKLKKLGVSIALDDFATAAHRSVIWRCFRSRGSRWIVYNEFDQTRRLRCDRFGRSCTRSQSRYRNGGGGSRNWAALQHLAWPAWHLFEVSCLASHVRHLNSYWMRPPRAPLVRKRSPPRKNRWSQSSIRRAAHKNQAVCRHNPW